MKRKKISSAKEAINQIFSQKYYQKFKKNSISSELFIMGVGFNPFEEKKIISEVLIKKYKGNDLPYGNKTLGKRSKFNNFIIKRTFILPFF